MIMNKSFKSGGFNDHGHDLNLVVTCTDCVSMFYENGFITNNLCLVHLNDLHNII